MDFSKTKVASAAVNHSKIDLSSTHITTANFMQLQPVYYRHMLPGEHIKGQGNVLSRLAPVAVPTYGRCRINMRAFFVPFRCVFPYFNEFIVDTIASDFDNTSLVADSPYISTSDMITMFFGNQDPYTGDLLVEQLNPDDHDDALAIAAGAYDFTIGLAFYRFSYWGRVYKKILESLGYRLVWDEKTPIVYSALPLLAYAKVFLDWYANSAYLNNQLYTDIAQMFKFIDPTSALHVDDFALWKILQLVSVVMYDSSNDVYLNAWDNPVSPNNGLSSSFEISDLYKSGVNTGDQGLVSVNPLSYNGMPVMIQDDPDDGYIGSSFLHQALKSMTDFVKRNQLAGAYQIDRFLARFGISLDSAKVDRSIYVGASSVDVDFGVVMQNTNTAGAGEVSNLGDYSGVGFGKGSLGFDFKADEFGFFVVVSSIMPAGHLFQGFDRNLLHLQKTDFYQPEFDNLGCQAIAKGEVYVSTNANYADGDGYQGVFGYAPRYYEYKQKSDFVTGDFVSPAAMQGGDAWHLNRILVDDSFGNIGNQTHSFNFTFGWDTSSYDRIFQYTNPDLDKFYLVYNFAVEALAPCKSLFDTYKFDELGQQLIMDNGAKLN